MKINLNEQEVDMLKEIGNIGMGNAITSLSTLLMNKKIDIDVPEVKIVSLGDLPDYMGGPDTVVAGVYVHVSGDVDMHIIFLLPLESAQAITETLLEGFSKTDDIEMSAVAEVGNIVTAGYLNAVAELTDYTLIPSPPLLAVDMTEAVLGTLFAELEVADDSVILVKTSFTSGQSKIKGYISLIPAKESCADFYQKLLAGGVDGNSRAS